MKFCNWEKVVISWANALNLTEEPANEIYDLLKGDYFCRLLKRLDINVEEYEKGNQSLEELIEQFLKEDTGFIIQNKPWDDKEATIIISLALLCGSLRSHDLRSPLYTLAGSTQLSIQAFIQRFISMPSHLINYDSVSVAIDEIPSDDENDSEPKSVNRSFVLTPGMEFSPVGESSPDLRRHSLAKMKSLQCKLELVEWDKQHLQEEVDSLKNDLDDLRRRYDIREHDFMKLESELFLCKEDLEKEENKEIVPQSGRKSNKSKEEKRLKAQLEEMERAMETLRTDLFRSMTRNTALESELERAEEGKEESEQRCAEAETKAALLSANVNDLEALVATLKQTCKEQREALTERLSFSFREEDSVASLGETETLATVVEKKYCEVEEELLKVKDELKTCLEEKANLLKTVEELKSRVNEREVEEREELVRIKAQLSAKISDLEEMKEDSEFLLASLEEKKLENEKLKTELNQLKQTGNFMTEETSELRGRLDCEMQRSEYWRQEGSSRNDKLLNEISHLNSLLDGKQVLVDETKALVNKLTKELNNKDNQISNLNDDLKLIKTKLAKKQCKITEMKKEITDRTIENENLKDGLAREQIEISSLKSKLRTLELEVENIRGDLRVKCTTVLALEQNVSMCEHEKAILERRIDLLKTEADKVENLRMEITRLKGELSRTEQELHAEKMELKKVQSQIEVEEKLNNAFDTKLADLQTRMIPETMCGGAMCCSPDSSSSPRLDTTRTANSLFTMLVTLKNQYEKDLKKTVDEYSDKIMQFKKKMLKDKNHIEELSAELWETSDRYLLASQENKALKNRYHRMRTALELLTSAPPTHLGTQQSNPCLWLDEEEDYDERIVLTREKWGRRYSFTSGRHGFLGADEIQNAEEEEVFNDACLEDLKAGVVRLPREQEFIVSRVSCPVSKTPDTSVEKTCDRQSLLPPEKPVRKTKGQISYSRPGPPTPSRHRLSLQSLDRVEPKLKERVQFVRETHGQTRLSRLFNLGQSKNANKLPPPSGLQVSPKAKRKSFFQRKFGSNRENIPP